MYGENKIQDRRLGDRSFVKFYFPNEGDSNYLVYTIPFLANLDLTENKRARYQKYNPIGRSSSLFAYTGADARSFSMKFSFYLDQILEELNENQGFFGTPFDTGNKELERQRFKLAQKGANLSDAFYYLQKTSLNPFPETPRENNFVENGIESLNGALDSLAIFGEDDTPNPLAPEAYDRNRTISTVVYWTNLIRSSVTNHASNPLLGPPIIRLNHGILYQDIPCVCERYSVKADDLAGYDLHTLLPRKLDFTMELMEVRAGDFGDFDPNHPIKKDNLAGWESVVGPHQGLGPGLGGF